MKNGLTTVEKNQVLSPTMLKLLPMLSKKIMAKSSYAKAAKAILKYRRRNNMAVYSRKKKKKKK